MSSSKDFLLPEGIPIYASSKPLLSLSLSAAHPFCSSGGTSESPLTDGSGLSVLESYPPQLSILVPHRSSAVGLIIHTSVLRKMTKGLSVSSKMYLCFLVL